MRILVSGGGSYKMRYNFWGDEELITLKTYYGKCTKHELSEMLPRRTYNSISLMALKLKLKGMPTGSNHRWQDRIIGLVDKATINKAEVVGIRNIAGGSISPQHGHVMIFCREFPGAHKSGYALRSRVVWWLNTGEIIRADDADIHHKRGNKIDDRFKQLEKLTHKDHSHHHNPKGLKRVNCSCLSCGVTFKAEGWKVRQGGGKFCSRVCFQSFPKSDASRSKLSATLKQKYFEGWRAS